MPEWERTKASTNAQLEQVAEVTRRGTEAAPSRSALLIAQTSNFEAL